MRRIFGTVIVCLITLVLVAASCIDDNGDNGNGGEGGEGKDIDLLMAATFGVAEEGSYVRYADQDVLEWRSRHEFDNGDFETPPFGFGECMRDGFDDQMSVFNLRRVYLFAKGGVPLDEQLQPLPRPIEIIQDRGDGPTLGGIPVNDPQEPTAAQFVADVNDLLGRAREAGIDPVVGLDFMFAATMAYGFGSDDPTPVDAEAESESQTAAAAADSGTQRRIWVADYGLPQGADDSAWPGNLDGVGQQPPPASGEPLTAQYGHGLMVGSVAAQAAPSAQVTVINVAEQQLNGREMITVSSIDAGLNNVGVFRAGPSVLNISLGAYDCDVVAANGDQIAYQGPMIAALEAVLEPYIVNPDIHVVAAAGNDVTDEPLYPAAFSDVIGVGATDDTVLNTVDCLVDGLEAWSPASASPDGDCQPDPNAPAPFSNGGGNVEDQRPGVDIIVHYPLLDPPIEYDYLDFGSNPVTLDTGKVRISGTSLAAPLLAACLQPDGNFTC